MQQRRVSWTLSVRKAASWYNSLFQKFGNSMLYFLAFTTEAPIQRFQNVCVNSHNKLYACSVPTRSPVHIMVFGVASSDSNFIPPLVFSYGLRFNTEDYINCLEEVTLLTRSTRAVKYANCNSTDLCPRECPVYDTKRSDAEAPVLELWESRVLLHCRYFQVHFVLEW